jgi:hypothetical protein
MDEAQSPVILGWNLWLVQSFAKVPIGLVSAVWSFSIVWLSEQNKAFRGTEFVSMFGRKGGDTNSTGPVRKRQPYWKTAVFCSEFQTTETIVRNSLTSERFCKPLFNDKWIDL